MGFVRWIFTVPAAWAGVAVTLIDVVELTTKVAVVVPNLTLVVPVRWVPVRVTVVPPPPGPWVGVNEVIVGGALALLYV